MTELAGQSPKPYFASYEVLERGHSGVSASFGVIERKSKTRSRWLDVDMRVGDYAFDNTHQFRGWAYGRANTVSNEAPVEDDDLAMRMLLWWKTDQAYKQAAENLARVTANSRLHVPGEDTSPDFSREKPSEYFETPASLELDVPAWESRLRTLSLPFRAYPQILDSSVSIAADTETRYYASSDGTRLQLARTHIRVTVTASLKAVDGMHLDRTESIDVPSVAEAPTDEKIRAKVDEVIRDLLALEKAPLAEPYLGPAILEGQAAGVFFHEVFGHRIEGHRQKEDLEGQTFAKKVGQPIMPAFMNVFDDPSVARINGTPVNGFYRFDNEGVASQKASLVEGGVLKTFLLGRSPTRGFMQSNGHGRRAAGYFSVARQGNLVVAPAETVSHSKLRELLLAEVKRQNKPYGLIVRQLDGGFTMTMKFLPQSFKLLPVMMYRLYPDGREELIRGADIDGTPLKALADIVAADDQVKTFNGHCGAESGYVPVSAASPSVLVANLEVSKKFKETEKPPLLPPPPWTKETP